MNLSRKMIALLIAAIMLYPLSLNSVSAQVNPTAPIAAVVNDGTRNIDFNQDWQFYLATRTPTLNTGGVKNGVQDPTDAPTTSAIIDPSFDDSSWRTVSVPHDWSIEGQKLSSGSNSQGYMQGGLGWYRKTFTLPDTMADKKVSIDFEGVYADSIVYVNGNLIGEYPSGYTGFAYDISSYLTYGSDSERDCREGAEHGAIRSLVYGFRYYETGSSGSDRQDALPASWHYVYNTKFGNRLHSGS